LSRVHSFSVVIIGCWESIYDFQANFWRFSLLMVRLISLMFWFLVDHQLHGRASCGNRVIWCSLPGMQMCSLLKELTIKKELCEQGHLISLFFVGKMFGNRGDCSDKEGFAGQKI
jgi:hypothetical protein